jgi:hypothetical protein
MKYTLNVSANNITYKAGDSLLVSFTEPFLYVNSIDSISMDISPLDTQSNGHDIDIRWSYDVAQLDRATGKPHVVWSAWESYSNAGIINPNIQVVYDNIISKNNCFDIQFRLVRRGSDITARRLDTVILELTKGKSPETPLDNQFPISSGCKATSCVTPNFSSGVVLNCDSNTLFRPYDVMNPGIQLWKDMSCAVSEMFGHCVRYFKTQAKLESADTILKEYSLYEVTDVKDIKIMVPDNAFPDNAIKFIPFDMDFEEGFEVHIVREHFERAFGQDDLPEQKDYLYFPLIDRIFEVHSAYLFRDFMAAEAYYKVNLFKWQDKANVMRDNPEIAQYIDDITEDFDEILQDEINKEFIDITKPQQYTTTAVGGFDKVRTKINDKLVIEVRNLTNYFTVVGKYFYDLKKSMSWGDLAVKYKLPVDRSLSDNTAFTMWFKTTKTSFFKSPETYDIMLDGYSDTENKGFRFNLDYEPGIAPNSAVAKGITVKVNGLTHQFKIPQLNAENWYGLVINHMNDYSQLSIHIWEMKYNPNQPSQNKTTDLRLFHTDHITITPEAVNYNGTYELRSGSLGITNLRIWSESMEEEKQPITINQYVVKDARYALLIDNAIPPLRLVKEYVR